MTDFQRFVENENKKADAQASSFDPQKRIELFKERICDLYARVDNEWLKGFIPDQIQTGMEKCTICEERLGAYDVYNKWLRIGEKKLMFKPIGTCVIGTDARVDLTYNGASVMFVWTGENYRSGNDLIEVSFNGETMRKRTPPGQMVWKMIYRDSMMPFQDVTTESLQRTIMDLVSNE